jgi:hypothetical protein
MDLDDGHPSRLLVQVDAVGDHLGRVRLDELGELGEPRLDRVELALADLGTIDGDEELGHLVPGAEITRLLLGHGTEDYETFACFATQSNA